MDNVSIQDFELDRNLTDAERASAVQVNWLDWKSGDAYEEGDLHRELQRAYSLALGCRLTPMSSWGTTTATCQAGASTRGRWSIPTTRGYSSFVLDRTAEGR